MGIVFRQSIKTTIVTFTGAGLGALVLYINTHLLSKTGLSLITTITYTAAIVQLFVIMGTANLISVYTQRYLYEDERRKALFTIGLLTSTVGTLIFSACFFLFKDSIVNLYKPEDQPLISKYYPLVPVLVYIWSLMTILDQYLIAHVKIAVSAFSREVLLRVCNLVLLVLLFFNVLSFSLYVLFNVLIYIIPVIVLFAVSTRTKGFGFSLNFKVFSLAELKDMLHFSWYHLLVGASLTILHFLDALMLGPLDEGGLSSTAPYIAATFLATVMYMPYRAMSTSSLPILNQAYIEKDMAKVNDLFTRAGANIIIVAVGMYILIGLNLDNALAVLPEGYENVKPLVLILMLGKLIDMATGLNNELISISKYYKFNFRIAVFLLVMVYVLDRIYIPRYGVFGAAWVATASVSVFNLSKMIFLYSKMKLHPFTRKTWLIVLSGIVAAAAGYFWPYILNPVVDTTLRSIVVLFVYGLMLIWLKPSNDLVVYLENIKKDKKLF
ncbi:MAG: lipopolysaccharide biosynthesis protein [Chitinophagaceae bacterium]|nr:lipopolysaccharide biosynthesis protein [Chitinophagaceae bacterium]MCB9044765.1 lipopolysaccharide biosynthesis protein [Chitinophagales bacterium]